MTLEHVGPVECRLSSPASVRTEAADNGGFVVSGNEMSVAIVSTCETSLVEFAGSNRALFWPFNLENFVSERGLMRKECQLYLVRQHVCFQVLVKLATVWVWASILAGLVLLVRCLRLAAVAARSRRLDRRMG